MIQSEEEIFLFLFLRYNLMKPVVEINPKYKNYKLFATILGLLILFFLFSGEVYAQDQTNDENEIYLHVFYGQGCPHCARLLSFLDSIKNKYPTLKIYKHEVYQDNEGRELFEKMSQSFEVPIKGVPTVFIDNRVIVGFSDTIGVSIEDQIKRCTEVKCDNPEFKQANSETIQSIGESSPLSEPKEKGTIQKLTIPVVISGATIDSINPCAFAVLIILMTVALSIADKKRALKFALAFIISIYISYFSVGLGLFFAIQARGMSQGFYIFVTILAVIVGLLNIKDYFWYGKGFLMEIPLSWRPTMKKIIHSVTSPLGAFLIGFIVSLFELPCTGGPYIVILGLLANEATRTAGAAYLLLYNLIFVMPLIILSIIIYTGLSTTEKLERIRQEKIRILHLIAGILMLVIAGIMILSIIKGWV